MAHIAKYQAAALGGMLAHYARTPELERGYRRDNIDPARTSLNYNLAPAHPRGQVDFIDGRIASLGLKRKVRKDAVRMCDCVLTMPKSLDSSRSREFFEDAYAFLANRYGAENVVSAYVHMDESTPHMHFAWVPVTEDGRLSAKDVVTRSSLRTLHSDLQEALQKAMGCPVDVLIPEDRRQEKAAKYVGLAEFKAATAGARKASERASEARKAAETAERAQRAAESRRRDSEAAAEASEKARKQAASDAESAKKDLETHRRRAKQLGPEGKGIDWQYTDGHVEHESSVGEVRADRDAAKAEAAAAMKKRDELLAFANEIRGERYEIDGRTYKGISAMADELKGLRADCAAAKNELAAAQDKAAAARRAAAEAEAAKAQAEALLSHIQDRLQEAQDAAQGTEQRLAHAKADLQESLAEAARAKQDRDRYARERLIDWTEIDSAVAEAARYVATVVVSLWDSARDFAVSVWRSWRSGWGLSITSGLGYSKQDHENVCDEQMAGVCVEQRRPDIAHVLGVDEEREERGYDDWER